MSKAVGEILVVTESVEIVGINEQVRNASAGEVIYEGERLVSNDSAANVEVQYLALADTTTYQDQFDVLVNGSVSQEADSPENTAVDVDDLETAAGEEGAEGSSGFIPNDMVANSYAEEFNRADGDDLLVEELDIVALLDDRETVVDIDDAPVATLISNSQLSVGLDTFSEANALSNTIGPNGRYNGLVAQTFVATGEQLDKIETELFERTPDSSVIIHVKELLANNTIGNTLYSTEEIALSNDILSVDNLGFSLEEGQSYAITIESVKGSYQMELDANASIDNFGLIQNIGFNDWIDLSMKFTYKDTVDTLKISDTDGGNIDLGALLDSIDGGAANSLDVIELSGDVDLENISVRDVIEITDADNTLIIQSSDNNPDQDVTVNLNEFTSQGSNGGFNIYTDGAGVMLKIETVIDDTII